MTAYFASVGDDLAAKASVLTPGDTLELNDGYYPVDATHQGLLVRGIFGTPQSPITIKAVNDGMVTIDGQGGAQGNFEPLFISNASHVNIQGIHCINSYGGVFEVYAGSGTFDGPVDSVTLKRCSGSGAGAGNHVIFDASFGCTNVLFEDCATYGPGRYMFLTYHSTNTTFRRCFAYWDTTGFVNTLLQPRSCFGDYGSLNTVIENCIGQHVFPSITDNTVPNNYFTFLYHTSDDQSNHPADNLKVLGCISFKNWEGHWINSDGGANSLVENCYLECPLDLNPSDQYTTTNQGDGLHVAGNAHNHTINKCTFANSNKGYSSSGSIGTITLKNSNFFNNVQAIETDPGHNNCNFFGNSINQAPVSLYSVNLAAPDLTTATELVTALGGAEVSSTVTTNGTVTSGWLEVGSRNFTLQTAQASIPAPTGKGWLFDTTLFEGQTFSGNWSGSSIYSTSGMANAAMSTTRRWSVRHANGTYTIIGSIALTSQTFGASGVHKTFTFSATAFASISFGVGDKLYVDEFVFATWGATSGTGFNEWQCSGSTLGMADHQQSNVPTPTPTLSTGDHSVDPGYNLATYGRAGAFFIGNDSPLHGQADDGSDIGANIIYCYQDGVQTRTPLWPWPMESRVQKEKGFSVTFDNGDGTGLWKTLNGVYPLGGIFLQATGRDNAVQATGRDNTLTTTGRG